MSRVVVVGSDNDPSFAVIDFSAPNSPVVMRVPPDPQFPFGACRVSIKGSQVAAGDSQGGAIRLIDVGDPLHPTSLGAIQTNLAGIGAIALCGPLVAAGELFSANLARVMLLDFSSPANPVLRAIALTPFASGGSPASGSPQVAAISSVVFLSDSLVLVAGPNQLQISRIDFGDPSNPTVTNLSQTHLGGPPAIDATPAQIAAGDGSGPHVNLFDSVSFTLLRSFNSRLLPVTSVAISESFVLAGSSDDAILSCIPLDGSPVQTVQANLGLGLVTALDGNVGACGGANSTFIQLVDLAVSPPALLGVRANVQFEAVTTLGISTFGSSPPGSGGAGSQSGSGGPGQGGSVVPPQGHPPIRPLSLRRFMESQHLDPARGLRVIRPHVTSVAEFILFS